MYSTLLYGIQLIPYETLTRVFNDLIDDFTKSDFKSFWDDFEIFKIILKYGNLRFDFQIVYENQI
jgi:hypothetical protein